MFKTALLEKFKTLSQELMGQLTSIRYRDAVVEADPSLAGDTISESISNLLREGLDLDDVLNQVEARDFDTGEVTEYLFAGIDSSSIRPVVVVRPNGCVKRFRFEDLPLESQLSIL